MREVTSLGFNEETSSTPQPGEEAGKDVKTSNKDNGLQKKVLKSG